jgi:isocitrate dehydrogenase kinase/phosphatase
MLRDEFGKPKDVDHATVRNKYQFVKNVDRVGRLADTLEFSDAALPLSRLSKKLLRELAAEVPSQIEIEGDDLIIKHVYIERRMVPLNIYLEQAEKSGRDDLIENAIMEYGNAIRELAIANIFPGDMLWKNFGVTRYGRVVFYDYDEIDYMTSCNFRRVPPAPYPEMELAAEPWYSVGKNDVFPEEFGTFLLASPRIRKAFLKHHADLLDVEFWLRAQDDIRNGNVRDFFPYAEALRFSRRIGKASPEHAK